MTDHPLQSEGATDTIRRLQHALMLEKLEYQRQGERLVQAVDMLRNLAAECSECAGTGKEYRYNHGERYQVSCRTCDDIRRVIKACSSVSADDQAKVTK